MGWVVTMMMMMMMMMMDEIITQPLHTPTELCSQGTMATEGENSQTMDNHSTNAILASIEILNRKINSMDAKINSLDLKVYYLEGRVSLIRGSVDIMEGESDLKAYLLRESSYERVFHVNDSTEELLCHSLFEGYANIWWDYVERFRNILMKDNPLHGYVEGIHETTQACNLYLWRPWKYDHLSNHDGRTNRYSFELNSQKFTLHSLWPSQVNEDHIKLRELKEKGNKQSEKKDQIEEWYEEEENKRLKGKMLSRNKDPFNEHDEKIPMLLLANDFHANQSTFPIPQTISLVLQDYKDMFPKKPLQGLPPLWGIEH
ncbi:hypothetical protein BC332_21135 [Capsicum chinense]|nr:hypothetical protein BC332_21135 [Capsicum chinense]